MSNKKYIELTKHFIYAGSLVLCVIALLAYKSWHEYQSNLHLYLINQEKFRLETKASQKKDQLKLEITNCMTEAKRHYNESVESICTNKTINCKIAIGYFTPKLLDPIITTLKKEQDLCIKLAS